MNEQHSFTTEQVLQQAAALRETGQYDQAIAWLTALLQQHPQHLEALTLLSHLQLLVKQPEAATHSLQRAIKIDSKHPLVMCAAARVLMQRQQFEQALAAAQTAHQAMPDDSQTQLVLASALLNCSQLEQAQQWIERILQTQPDYPEAWASRALLHLRRGQSGAAIADIQQALQRKRHVSAWWQLLFKLQLEAGNLGAAITALQQCMQLEPDEPGHPAVLGELLRRAGQIEAAMALLNKNVAAHPGHYPSWLNLGTVLQEALLIEQAQQAYEKALALKPDSAEIASNLGVLAKEQENWPLALQYFEQALRFQPGNLQFADNRLAALIKLKRFEEARAALDAAMQNRPATPTVYVVQASLQTAQGELNAAWASMRVAVEMAFAQLRQRTSDQLKDKSPKPMSVSEAGDSLLALHELFTSLQVPYFIAFGTLLGIVRDGELLPFDKDMDVGLPWDMDRHELMDRIEAHGDWLVKGREHLDAHELQWTFAIVHKPTGILTDLFFFKSEGDTMLSGLGEEPNPLLWRFSAIDIGSIAYRGVQLPAPADPERFMLEIYGEDWRVPNPYFDSVVVGCNLTPESLPTAIAAGWSNLYKQLDKFAWKKAWGYCQQLLRYGDDVLLRELGAWCEGQVTMKGDTK